MQNIVSIWKSRGINVWFKVRFLKATAFRIPPVAIYACQSCAMTSGDKIRALMHSNCGTIEGLFRVSWVERKMNKWVLGKIGSVLVLRNGMAERKMRFFDHLARKLDVADASQLAADRERWRELIRIIAEQLGSPDLG